VATTKKPAGTTRRLPVRATTAKPATVPATANRTSVPVVPVGERSLVYAGGASLIFHDGTGARHHVLRGVPFTVDAKTADILRSTDPAILPADNSYKTGGISSVVIPTTVDVTPNPAEQLMVDGEILPIGTLARRPIQGGNTPADDPAVDAAGEAGTPPSPAPSPVQLEGAPSGAITLGDLSPGARIAREG
jgi:hypothetical protein